jgi:hypothetical protein
MGKSQNLPVDLDNFLQRYAGDPALKVRTCNASHG